MVQDEKLFLKQFGQRIAALRKERGLTQARLAERLAVSQQLLAAYEKGTRKMPLPLLPALGRFFSVPIDELLGMNKAPKANVPAAVLERQMAHIRTMPETKQVFIAEVLKALIKHCQRTV